MSYFDLDILKTFITIVEKGSFTKADPYPLISFFFNLLLVNNSEVRKFL